MTYKCTIPAALSQNLGKYVKMQKKNKNKKTENKKKFYSLVPTAKK